MQSSLGGWYQPGDDKGSVKKKNKRGKKRGAADGANQAMQNT